MLYASVAQHKAAVPAQADATIGDALLLSALKAAANDIDGTIGKQYVLPVADRAMGSVALTTNPADGKKIVCGSTTWYFKTTPTLATHVQIGTDLAASLTNFLLAYATDVQCTAVVTATVLWFLCRQGGTPGNTLALSSDISGATVTAFSGGAHDFEMLTQSNISLAAEWINTGQEVGYQNAQGGGFKELADKARDYLKALEKGSKLLIDAEGVLATYSTANGPISNTSGIAPFADEGPPENWGYDPSKVFDRES